MGKALKVFVLMAGMAVLFNLSTAHAFSSAAHIYIAEQVYGGHSIDLDYGSTAPDLAIYTDADAWPTAFDDTHYNYIDLKAYAKGSSEKAFAKGWLTHNEVWGADYYAHIVNPLGGNQCATTGYYQGYVIEKACLLSGQTGISPDFAHLVIEIAMDLLLRNNVDRDLGRKLFYAGLFRSPNDRNLLSNVLVRKEHRTDWTNFITTEMTFRAVVDMYAVPLKLPEPLNERALAKLGVKLAELYGMYVTEEQILALLDAATALCEPDYRDLMEDVITAIKGHPGM